MIYPDGLAEMLHGFYIVHIVTFYYEVGVYSYSFEQKLSCYENDVFEFIFK